MILLLSMALAGLGDGLDAYDAGEFDEAAAAWTAAPGSSQGSGSLYYNLGHAYFDGGDFPRAVGAYRTASRLRPRDSDVQHALALARAELEQATEPVGAHAPWMLALTAGELGVLGWLVTALGSVLLLVRSRINASRAPGLATMALGGLMCATATWGAWAVRSQPVAVVLETEAFVRDSPSASGSTRFSLSQGAEVFVVAGSVDGFVLVEDVRERRGWAPAGALWVPWPSR